jgi:hypothetical protein
MPTLAKLNGTGPSDRDYDGLKARASARRHDLRLTLIIAVEQLNARAAPLLTWPVVEPRLRVCSASLQPIKFRLSGCRGRPFVADVNSSQLLSRLRTLARSTRFSSAAFSGKIDSMKENKRPCC